MPQPGRVIWPVGWCVAQTAVLKDQSQDLEGSICRKVSTANLDGEKGLFEKFHTRRRFSDTLKVEFKPLDATKSFSLVLYADNLNPQAKELLNHYKKGVAQCSERYRSFSFFLSVFISSPGECRCSISFRISLVCWISSPSDDLTTSGKWKKTLKHWFKKTPKTIRFKKKKKKSKMTTHVKSNISRNMETFWTDFIEEKHGWTEKFINISTLKSIHFPFKSI